MNYTNIFYPKIKERYKKRKLDFVPNEIKKTINNLSQQARKNYSKLSEPKFCSLKSYISVWINEEISKDIAQKSLISINSKNPPNEFKASVKFYTTYQTKKNKQNINLDEMRNDWLEMVKERNEFSIKMGFKSRLDMTLKNFKIPKIEYNKFQKNIDKTIDFYKHQIQSKLPIIPIQNLNNFCFICNLETFPFNNLSDFLNFFKEKESFFKKNEGRIKIKFGNCFQTDYIKENDNFVITLKEKLDIRHQILELIHELSHVISMATILKQDKFTKSKAYLLEKLAIKKEIFYIKKYFPEVFLAKIGNILQTICQTLFEIDIYQNPNQDPDKLYSKYWNKCFRGILNNNNQNYLSNQDIVYKSFSQLIYTISYINVLNKSKEK